MNESIENTTNLYHAEPVFPHPKVELIESDGIPLESSWHATAIPLLKDVVNCHFPDRDDIFCGGNLFLYYSEEQARNRDYRGPDFFFVKGVPRHKKRPWYAVWEENGRFPNMILELLSPSTVKIDRVNKKALYETVFRTPEYFVYDFDEPRLEGWRLDAKLKYQPIEPNDNGWLWCEEIGMWLGIWHGSYLDVEADYPRFYTADGQLAPTASEREGVRAEQEKNRADSAEAELKRLQSQLEELRKKSDK